MEKDFAKAVSALASVWKKWPPATFSVFTRVCVHAFGVHLSLEKCKKTTRRWPLFANSLRKSKWAFYAI